MNRQIFLKLSWEAEAVEVKPELVKYGPYAYVILFFDGHTIKLAGRQEDLAAELRRLAALAEPVSVDQIEQLPKVLARPETAWPFLVDRYPWLFADIGDLSSEPYYHFLKQAQDKKDAAALRPHVGELLDEDGGRIRGYTRRAAEILFGDPDSNGGAYLTRIKKAMARLKTDSSTNSTTAEKPAAELTEEQKRAA